MAAVFVDISPGRSLFKGDVSVVSAVGIDFMNGFVGPDTMAIITSVSTNNTETIQYFLSFDDVINYFYFGKGLGSLTISGLIFSDCYGRMGGVDSLYFDAIGKARGKVVSVSIGRAVFRCVIQNFTTEVQVQDTYLTAFSINLSIIDHNLPSIGSPSYIC